MEYRRLGRTRERVSTIGMGTWRIGSYGSQEERDLQVKVLRRGIELGLNLIDTAEMYAGGKSEEVVGEAISGTRDSAFIATKVSPGHLDREGVVAACEGSLRRLSTAYIDLYQVHWPNPAVPIKETMGAMEELVRSGKIRYIGVSNFTVEQTEEAREALRGNELASNQVEYSLASRGVEKNVLPYCEREKLSLIAYTPLAHGSFPVSGISRAVCQTYRMTPAQAMLNWVTRREQVLAIPKTAKMEHMEENAASVSVRFAPAEYDSFGPD